MKFFFEYYTDVVHVIPPTNDIKMVGCLLTRFFFNFSFPSCNEMHSRNVRHN